MKTDIRVIEVEPTFRAETLRTPLKFGAGLVREITSCTVRTRVESRAGKTADGFGNILLSDLWAWPSALEHAVRDGAMRALVEAWARKAVEPHEYAHPLEHFMRLEAEQDALRAGAARSVGLADPIPVLASLVCLSPIDAAIHDACAVAAGRSSYEILGPDCMKGDLERFIGPVGAGRTLSEFVTHSFAHKVPVWHLVGGVDKLRQSEKTPEDPADGLPVSLDEWIERDGIFCFKVKLRGADVAWDVERTAQVAAVAQECLAQKGAKGFCLSIDSNEMTPSPEAVLEYLRKLQERSRPAFDQLLYIEQPTERELEAHRFSMSSVASLKPVLADEGITDLGKIDVARDLGWSGIALKTCKCHSAALLAAAKASLLGLVYSVQDLTNVGLGLVHSAGLAARTRPIKGVEYNSRQFLPGSDKKVREAHARLFHVRDGYAETGGLSKHGLGYDDRVRKIG